jgi:ribokinase
MGKKIACFGSFIAELTSRVDRLPRPGESMLTDYFKLGAGGKGSNQACAVKRAGGNIVFMAKIGNDLLSQIARDHYKKEGFDLRYILTDNDYPTGVAIINVDKNTGENSIIVVTGVSEHCTAADIELFRNEIESCDIFLAQLEANIDAVENVVQIAWENKKTIILNTAPAKELPDSLLSKVSIVIPNEIEAEVLTKIAVVDKSSAEKAARVFYDKGIPKVIITLGKNGCYIFDGKEGEMIDAIPVKTVDTTGAGDAFIGGLVTALSEDLSLSAAVRFATATAALSTTKMGTSIAMPFRNEIDELVKKTYGKLM